MAEENTFEVVVIGSGPGGYVCAIRAAQLGFKTAVIEKSPKLGGTCLNVGCIPSKALLASSEYFHFAKERFAEHGIQVNEPKIDVTAMMKRKDAVVLKLNSGVAGLMKKNKIAVFHGVGKLVDSHTIDIALAAGGNTMLKAENVVLATGSIPVELPFLPFDGHRVISSDEGIALPEVPREMAVIGAGAIGLELGSVWNRLGAKVTVLEFLPRIAAFCDSDVSRYLERVFTQQGIKFHTNTKVESGEVTKSGVTLKAKKGDEELEVKADPVLVAVGRKPYAGDAGLEAAGVELTAKGRIKIDEHFRTSVPNIYAIGDVVDGPMLAHKAGEEGVAVAEKLAGKPGLVNPELIPNVIYTSPEVATVGLGEDAAKERGHAILVGKTMFSGNGRAIANDATDGFVKIVADQDSDRVLGVSIVAHNASELIAEVVALMEFGGSADDLARTIHAHPTTAETVKEAALAVHQRAIHG